MILKSYFLCPKKISYTRTEFSEWMNNYIHMNLWDKMVRVVYYVMYLKDTLTKLVSSQTYSAYPVYMFVATEEVQYHRRCSMSVIEIVDMHMVW